MARFNFLRDLIKPKAPEEAPIGSGMARQAADTISARKQYNTYVESTQLDGGTPLSFEEWRKSKGI